jgi:hypothetical protein
MRLVFSGKPGGAFNAMMLSFVLLVPVAVAAVTVYLAERAHRRSWSYYFWAGAGANALFVVGTLLINIEGIICAILIVPLFGLLGGIAGLLAGAICRKTVIPRDTLYCLAALPLLLGGFEQYLPIPQEIHTVERVRLVHARPKAIWPHLALAKDIRPEEIGSAWMYRIGVPLPLSAVSDSADGVIKRHITMGKNVHFDQVASDWAPERRVRWTYRFTANSFPPGALDDHVRIGGEFFDMIDTEYTLREVAGGTELRSTMRYRLSTPFNWYTRPLAAFLVGDFEDAALNFYARRAEAS